jgi:phosphoglucomutase
MMGPDAPDFGAASDGDGDRNLIIGKGVFVTPSDSLAMLAANAHLAPGYKDGLKGIARSMPTSGAADRVAAKLGVEMHETPTGWKFFGNLLDAGRCTICGEESAGTGSDHVREKDGLWAVLLWLNIVAVRRQSVIDIVEITGRLTDGPSTPAMTTRRSKPKRPTQLMAALQDETFDLPAPRGSLTIERADSFTYHDPIDGSISRNQGSASSLKVAHAWCSGFQALARRAPRSGSIWNAMSPIRPGMIRRHKVHWRR